MEITYSLSLDEVISDEQQIGVVKIPARLKRISVSAGERLNNNEIYIDDITCSKNNYIEALKKCSQVIIDDNGDSDKLMVVCKAYHDWVTFAIDPVSGVRLDEQSLVASMTDGGAQLPGVIDIYSSELFSILEKIDAGIMPLIETTIIPKLLQRFLTSPSSYDVWLSTDDVDSFLSLAGLMVKDKASPPLYIQAIMEFMRHVINTFTNTPELLRQKIPGYGYRLILQDYEPLHYSKTYRLCFINVGFLIEDLCDGPATKEITARDLQTYLALKEKNNLKLLSSMKIME